MWPVKVSDRSAWQGKYYYLRYERHNRRPNKMLFRSRPFREDIHVMMWYFISEFVLFLSLKSNGWRKNVMPFDKFIFHFFAIIFPQTSLNLVYFFSLFLASSYGNVRKDFSIHFLVRVLLWWNWVYWRKYMCVACSYYLML